MGKGLMQGTGFWHDGNEAIRTDIDRQRPWCGTVFEDGVDDEADGLVALTFGLNIEECVHRARLASAAPALLSALQVIGAMPDGYCFCFGGRRDASKLEHSKGCHEARAAIAQAIGES